jgi:hypothetical protein
LNGVLALKRLSVFGAFGSKCLTTSRSMLHIIFT